MALPQEYAGQTITCPSCQNNITVPGSPRTTSVIYGSAEKSVFFDRHRIRWRRVRNIFVFLIGVIAVLLVCLGISVIVHPLLPSLGLDAAGKARTEHQYSPLDAQRSSPGKVAFAKMRGMPAPGYARGASSLKERRETNRKGQAGKLSGKETPGSNILVTVTDRQLTMAFAVPSDEMSLASLKQNMDSLDVVIPDWLKLTADGTVDPLMINEQKEISRLLRASPSGPALVPLITPQGSRIWPRDEMAGLLASGVGRAGIISALFEYARGISVDGFCVDFEGLPTEQMTDYAIFIDELAQRLHADNKVLYVCASAEWPPLFRRRLAQAADMVIIKAYGQHSEAGAPGPLAAQNWFEGVITSCVADIPQSKLGIAFGNYACDWIEEEHTAVSVSFDKAAEIACAQQAVVRLDPASLNPAFQYEDKKRRRHQVWFLDAVTAFNQLAAAKKVRPRGMVLSRLGNEDAVLWRFYGKADTLDGAVCPLLADMKANCEIDYLGKGEVIRIVATAEAGRRRVTFDEQRGLITACDYEKLPTSYVLQQYGASPSKIALTFDDGPDPAYTPAILDILHMENVRATFFILGTSAEHYPDIIRRMGREGHEIGNHTFTHPNISKISLRQIEMELAATQRVLEGTLGCHTLLFRPPYGEDSRPSTLEEIRMLEAVNNLGYWTVGMHVDPSDWRSPPADTIVKRTLAQIQEGRGNIVLLHDGGGERAQTVQALPQLIAELKQHRYVPVTVSELLGRKRDKVMPPLTGAQRVLALTNRLAFGLVGTLLDILKFLFMLGIILGMARLLFIGLLAAIDVRRKRRFSCPANYNPSVAVIVPAYNEENVICQTIRSLLKSKCPFPLEVVVVDDGSKDNTYQRAWEEFGRHPAVFIFKTANAGKPAALNFGISQTSADIIVAMDADTLFAWDTIWKLVRHFSRKNVGAVAGNAKVGNRINVLTKWQALEYITSQNLERRAFNVMGCITVVPGAVGAWRRELLVKAGGFGQATLAEDADLTIAIRRMGYSVVNEDEAYAYTEAPVTIGGFVRQRYRWMYGTLQAAWRHKRMVFNPRYGAMGLFALPSIFIFQVFFPLISPVLDLLAVCALGRYAWDAMRGTALPVHDLVMVLAYYGVFVMVDFAAAALAFALEPKEDKRLLWWLFPQRFCYRQLMYYVAIKSISAALRGVEVGWNKLKRTATVKVQGQ